jgi:hypothetical protein
VIGALRLSQRFVALAIACLTLLAPTIVSYTAVSSSRVHAATPEGTMEIVEQPFSIRISQYGVFRVLVPESVMNDNNAAIEVRVHGRITTRQQVQDVSDDGAIPRVTDVATVTIPNITVDDTGALVVRVPLQASNRGLSGLYMAELGVYPITIVARQEGRITAQTLTYVHRVAPDNTPEPVTTSLVVALRATPSIQPDGAVVVSDDLRDRINRFVDTITSVNAPFTIAIQPEILWSLQNSPDNQDSALLERLTASLTGRTLALLPFVPIDVSAASRAGATEEYLRQLRLGEDVLLQLLPNSVVQRSTAIISDSLDATGINLLRDAGRRTIIATPSAMDDFQYSSSSSVKNIANHNDASPMTMLLSDQTLHEVMKSPVSKPVERAHRMIAELLLHQNDLQQDGIKTADMRFVISTFDGTSPSQQLLQSLVALLRADPAFTLINSALDSPSTTSDAQVTVPRISSGDISERTNALARLQVERDATSSMLPDDDPRIVFWEQLDGLIISSEVDDYVPYVDGLEAQFQDLRDAVTLANPGSITLGSRNGDIRLQMRNTAPEDLTVRILMSSPKLEFPGGPQVVTLTARSTTDIVIPVRTRTNGRFPVLISVTTPEGDYAVLAPTTFSARVTAIAGLGQLVMISFILIVLAWWWASWRKSRRERAAGGTVLHA